MEESLRIELKKFGETTSVRGVPRAFKTQDKILRVVWIVALIVSISMTIWQLEKVFTKYFGYQTVSTVQEVFDKAYFPWVTVCSLSPPSDTMFADLKWTQYIAEVEEMKANYMPVIAQAAKEQKMSTDYLVNFLNTLESPSGYIANLPLPRHYNTSGGGTTFIVDCNYYDWQLNLYGSGSINCRGTVSMVWDPNYFRCYSFRPPDEFRSGIRALTAFFYVNDFSTDINKYFSTNVQLSQATGIKVSVHANSTGAKIEVGERIGPGTETLVHVAQTRHTRMPEPYGSCTGVLLYQSMEVREGDTVYTSDTCFGLCMQELFVQACHCLAGYLPFNQSQAAISSYTLCYNQSLIYNSTLGNQQEFSAFAKRAMCMYNMISAVSDQIQNCDCPEPCSEWTYDVRAVGSPWPHRSFQLAFYDDYIKKNPDIYGNHFDIYQNISDLVGNVTDEDIMNLIDDAQLIENNFVRIDVLFDSYSSLELAEVPAMTVELLASNIGGTLSLWMGLTTIALIEIIELLYNLLVAIYRSRRQTIVVDLTKEDFPGNVSDNLPQKIDVHTEKQGIPPDSELVIFPMKSEKTGINTTD